MTSIRIEQISAALAALAEELPRLEASVMHVARAWEALGAETRKAEAEPARMFPAGWPAKPENRWRMGRSDAR